MVHLSPQMGGRKRGIPISVVLAIAASLPSLRGEDRIYIGYGEGTPGTKSISVPVLARHDLPIHGFSLSIAWPRKSLRLIAIHDVGTATEAIGTQFFHPIIDNTAGTAVTGAIFTMSETTSPIALPPTPADGLPQLIAWLVFDLEGTAPLGLQSIELHDGTGNPAISNRFTSAGRTIVPRLTNGSILVNGGDVMTVESKYALPGFRAPTLFVYARHAIPLQGFQIAIAFDPRQLVLEEATFTGTSVNMLLGMAKVEFWEFRTKPEEIAVSETKSRTTAGAIFDYIGPYDENQVLPPETGSSMRQSLVRYSFQPKDGADQYGPYAALTLDDNPDGKGLNNVFVANFLSSVPRKVNGRIYFSTSNLSGKVLDFSTGSPLGSAHVSLEPGNYTTTTTAGGSFLFTDIMPGPFSLTVAKDEYFSGQASVQVDPNGATTDAGTVYLFEKPKASGFRRGLVTPDADMNLTDAVALLGYIFLGSATPTCLEAADVNDDARLDLTDAVVVLQYLFLGGKTPPDPFALCGQDPTPDDLGCTSVPDGACK